MTFFISALVSSLDPYKPSAIALSWYGSFWMIPGLIWKRPCYNLYLWPSLPIDNYFLLRVLVITHFALRGPLFGNKRGFLYLYPYTPYVIMPIKAHLEIWGNILKQEPSPYTRNVHIALALHTISNHVQSITNKYMCLEWLKLYTTQFKLKIIINKKK